MGVQNKQGSAEHSSLFPARPPAHLRPFPQPVPEFRLLQLETGSRYGFASQPTLQETATTAQLQQQTQAFQYQQHSFASSSGECRIPIILHLQSLSPHLLRFVAQTASHIVGFIQAQLQASLKLLLSRLDSV